MSRGQIDSMTSFKGGKHAAKSLKCRTIHLSSIVFASIACFAGSLHGQSLDSLANQIRSGNTEQKRDALCQIRNLRSQEASRIAVPALSDKNEMVRATAASAVVFLPKPEANGYLLPLLDDKAEFVRREVVFALGEVGDPAAAAKLIKSLTQDKSQEVRSAAAIALGKTGNPIAINPLTAILAQPPSENFELIRRAAARSIGQIAQIMQIVSPEVSNSAESSPTRTDRVAMFREASRTLIKVLESAGEADDTRREAAFALGAIGDRSAEAVLEKYKTSRDSYLADICKQALLKLHSVE